MHFGEAKYVRGTDIPAVVMGIGPSGRVMVWTDTFHSCLPTALIPWECMRCRGVASWWTFRQRPTCAICSPMPSEIVRSLWDEFHSFIAELADGSEDREGQAVLWAGFDELLAVGDRTTLLGYLFHKQRRDWHLARIK